MKVFGIGLNKTGTTTLGSCLEYLGFNHLSCRRDLLVCYRSNDLETIFSVIDNHSSFEDWPYPLMYREIYDRYGDQARFILTTRRTPSIWIDSLKRHAVSTHPDLHCRLLAYGFNYPHDHEREHIAFYEQHNADVRAFFSANADRKRLFLDLCWEHGDGWHELCHFLNRPVPDRPFPHLRKGSEIVADPVLKLANERRILAERQAVPLR